MWEPELSPSTVEEFARAFRAVQISALGRKRHLSVVGLGPGDDIERVSLLRLIGIGVNGENAEHKTPAVNGRRHGRVRCELMKSSHGDVLDVSASGMRVTFKGAPEFIPGQEFDVDLETIEGCLKVGVRVVWIRKISITRFEAGMEFLGLTADQKQMLAYVARASSTNESLRPQDERGR